MNEIAIELGKTLSLNQKILLRDLCLIAIDDFGADFEMLEPILEATQHERFFNQTYSLSTANNIINKYKDGILL